MPAPAGCPVDHAYSTFSTAYQADPYKELEKRRNNSQVFYAEDLGCLVLTRIEDVAEDFDPIPVMSHCQRPDHTRIRKHTQAGFLGRRMPILEPYIRRRCETLVSAMLETGAPAEFVSHVGYPMPGETIFRLIGFPERDNRKIKD